MTSLALERLRGDDADRLAGDADVQAFPVKPGLRIDDAAVRDDDVVGRVQLFLRHVVVRIVRLLFSGLPRRSKTPAPSSAGAFIRLLRPLRRSPSFRSSVWIRPAAPAIMSRIRCPRPPPSCVNQQDRRCRQDHNNRRDDRTAGPAYCGRVRIVSLSRHVCLPSASVRRRFSGLPPPGSRPCLHHDTGAIINDIAAPHNADEPVHVVGHRHEILNFDQRDQIRHLGVDADRLVVEPSGTSLSGTRCVSVNLRSGRLFMYQSRSPSVTVPA